MRHTKRFSERNPTLIGSLGIVVIAAVLALALNSGAIYRGLTSTSYSAMFPEAGGLLAGDEVRIGGLTVGKVSAIDLDLQRRSVRVDFTVQDTARIGRSTRAAVKTLTPLGKKFLAVTPQGPGVLASGSEIPLERTNAPYDVAEALSDLTTTTGQIDTTRFAASLDTLADTFKNTSPGLAATLDGLKRLSTTISSRDDTLRALLANANGVSGVLAQRSGQIETLINDGNLLLTELYQRRNAIRSLLVNTTRVVEQLRGVVHDNQEQVGPALDELEKTLDLLNENQDNLNKAIPGLRTYARTLGEAVGSGPFFQAYVSNLPPTNLAPLLPELLEKGTGPGVPPLVPTTPTSPRTGGNR